MSDSSLVRSREGLDGRSVAAAVHDLCSWAVHQQGMTAPVPVLHPLASGDQLAVIGGEFLDWVELAGDPSALSQWRGRVDLIRQAA